MIRWKSGRRRALEFGLCFTGISSLVIALTFLLSIILAIILAVVLVAALAIGVVSILNKYDKRHATLGSKSKS